MVDPSPVADNTAKSDEMSPENHESQKSSPPPTSRTSSSPRPNPRPERTRKPTECFRPDPQLRPRSSRPKGRGLRLGSMAATRQALTKASPQDRETLHQLLFQRRRNQKIDEADKLPQILLFKGYLPPTNGLDEDELEELEEEAEIRYSTKAFKLRKAEIIRLCDILAIERSNKPLKKEALIDLLLDFLGAPSEDLLIGAGQKKRLGRPRSIASSKSAGKKRKRDQDDSGSVDQSARGDGGVESHTGSTEEESHSGNLPSDNALRKWVQAFVQCYNMDKVSMKVAVEIASDKFGVDMLPKKETIKTMLVEEL